MAEEAKLQRWLLDYFDSLGIYSVKVISSNRSGTPDVLACIDGRFVAVEVKSSKGFQSKLQKLHQRQIEEEGGRYFLLNPSNKIQVQGELRRLAFQMQPKHREV